MRTLREALAAHPRMYELLDEALAEAEFRSAEVEIMGLLGLIEMEIWLWMPQQVVTVDALDLAGAESMHNLPQDLSTKAAPIQGQPEVEILEPSRRSSAVSEPMAPIFWNPASPRQTSPSRLTDSVQARPLPTQMVVSMLS